MILVKSQRPQGECVPLLFVPDSKNMGSKKFSELLRGCLVEVNIFTGPPLFKAILLVLFAVLPLIAD